jgi:hypothetical protein
VAAGDRGAGGEFLGRRFLGIFRRFSCGFAGFGRLLRRAPGVAAVLALDCRSWRTAVPALLAALIGSARRSRRARLPMRAALACIRAHALVVAAAAVLAFGALPALGLASALGPVLARLRFAPVGLPRPVPAAAALIHAITGRSTCTLPSRSMRCEKHERRN